MNISKIISGGQTGVDIGALDAAIFCNIPHGGFCPKGRKQENGNIIPDKYQLTEMKSVSYIKRTEANVVNSDATLIIAWQKPSGGTLKTLEYAEKYKKPYLLLIINELSDNSNALKSVGSWFAGDAAPPNKCTLNVAGSRESEAIGIQEWVKLLMIDVIQLQDQS